MKDDLTAMKRAMMALSVKRMLIMDVLAFSVKRMLVRKVGSRVESMPVEANIFTARLRRVTMNQDSMTTQKRPRTAYMFGSILPAEFTFRLHP